MIPHFKDAEKAVHYPADRRAYLWMKPYIKIILLALVLGTFGAAWLQYLLLGLPANPTAPFEGIQPGEPSGFPVWISVSHWVNFFFLMLIIRSGLSILADHPRLYWNNCGKPNSSWIRLTPVKVPLDKMYTAKEDAGHLNPIAGLPGYKHTVGIARVWHFLTGRFFLLNGVVFKLITMRTQLTIAKKLVPYLPGK